MKQKTGQVMSASPNSKELPIQLVRYPGDGVPIALFEGGERPTHILPGQTAFYVRVVVNIGSVIVVDKGMSNHGRVHKQSGEPQQETESKIPLRRRQFWHGSPHDALAHP